MKKRCKRTPRIVNIPLMMSGTVYRTLLEDLNFGQMQLDIAPSDKAFVKISKVMLTIINADDEAKKLEKHDRVVIDGATRALYDIYALNKNNIDSGVDEWRTTPALVEQVRTGVARASRLLDQFSFSELGRGYRKMRSMIGEAALNRNGDYDLFSPRKS